MGIHGGHRKKTQHARSRDRWLRGPRSRPDRYWTDPRHCKDRAGIEGKFLAMDERPSGGTIWLASRIFRVQRQPIPGADSEAVHCKPKRAPSKDRLCYRVRVVVEEAWICIAGLIARAAFMPSPTGLG